jgi:hypothetical protein
MVSITKKTSIVAGMKSREVVTMLATTAFALGAIVVGSAVAAPPPAAPIAGITGFAQSKVPGCPNINWRLARHTDGKITGIFWYSDLSGTSEALGTEDPTGRFHIQVTSSIGSGPVGVVDGTRSPQGKVVADMKGEGCANDHVVRMYSVPDINKLGTLANPG